MSWISSQYISTLTILVTMDIAKVMFLMCHVTSPYHMFKGLYITLWVEALQIFNLLRDFTKPFD